MSTVTRALYDICVCVQAYEMCLPGGTSTLRCAACNFEENAIGGNETGVFVWLLVPLGLDGFKKKSFDIT